MLPAPSRRDFFQLLLGDGALALSSSAHARQGRPGHSPLTVVPLTDRLRLISGAGGTGALVPAANVLVAGDVTSVEKYPIADYTTGGWPGGLATATRTLLDLTNAGHGSSPTARRWRTCC